MTNLIMTSPMRLTTIPTMTLVRQTARPTKVPSTAVDKLVQIITATVGEVKVLLVSEGTDLEENIKDDPSSLRVAISVFWTGSGSLKSFRIFL